MDLLEHFNTRQTAIMETIERDKVLTDEFIKQMSEGVWLEELERKTLPCKVRKQGERRFSIILTQGLNRQIRRMCQACGYRVHLLRRVRIMNIQLGGLKTGEFLKHL